MAQPKSTFLPCLTLSHPAATAASSSPNSVGRSSVKQLRQAPSAEAQVDTMDPYDYEVAILVPSKKAVETIDISSSSEGEDGALDRVHVKQEKADDAAAMDCAAEHEEVAPPPPADVHLTRRGPRIEAGEEWDDFCMYPNLVEMNPTQVDTLRYLVDEKRPAIPFYVCTIKSASTVEGCSRMYFNRKFTKKYISKNMQLPDNDFLVSYSERHGVKVRIFQGKGKFDGAVITTNWSAVVRKSKMKANDIFVFWFRIRARGGLKLYMDRRWITTRIRRLSPEHTKGVAEFMQFVRLNAANVDQVLCPCRSCLNRCTKPLDVVESHLLLFGMASTYDRWVFHGEPLHPVPEAGHGGQGGAPEAGHGHGGEPEAGHGGEPEAGHGGDAGAHHVGGGDAEAHYYGLQEEDGYEDDRIPDLLADLYNSEPQGAGKDTIFAELIEEAKRAASDGGTMSRFSLTVKLLQAKSYYRISNVAFNAILLILALQYPNSSIPKSYEEALSIVGRLGLGYESIHVCPNNCVLFRKDYAKENNCPKCKASRWKDADGRRKIPEKVLRHFPLIPRLQRMFLSKEQSKEVQWHKLKRQDVENDLSHPADGDAWKDFDNIHKDFAADARNIRLGLATDGFNPYGNMSNSYSMWPVFVVPYNLPPWACMDQSNFMLALLIPGPSSPGKDFDVFMEPLMEELQELWKGVKSYDANSPDKFDLRAAILWCIHDYPALHTLSGRATAGYQACVRCDKENCSKKLRNKICFIGHRRWLPRHHPWRNSKEFDSASESREKPAEFTPEELKQQLDRVRDVIPGKLQKKRKRED
ncbi:hypothetical protein QYE76_008934, partial [Lolium multiflorum]